MVRLENDGAAIGVEIATRENKRNRKEFFLNDGVTRLGQCQRASDVQDRAAMLQ